MRGGKNCFICLVCIKGSVTISSVTNIEPHRILLGSVKWKNVYSHWVYVSDWFWMCTFTVCLGDNNVKVVFCCSTSLKSWQWDWDMLRPFQTQTCIQGLSVQGLKPEDRKNKNRTAKELLVYKLLAMVKIL